MEWNKELTSGYGRFECLGRPVAFMELNKVFVELLRRFELDILNLLKPMKNESHVTFVQSELFKATKREAT
jgi:cytochrome P450